MHNGLTTDEINSIGNFIEAMGKLHKPLVIGCPSFKMINNLNNNKMNTEKQQQDLIASIKNELSKEIDFSKPCSYFHSVWFQPSSGRFIYADQYTRYEVVEPLIENKTLIFKGVENHQGEQMLRYVLYQGCR